MKRSRIFFASCFFLLAFNSHAQDEQSLDAMIFDHDLGWIKLHNAAGLNVEVSDQVSDGCWTNISAVQNAVELQLIRSGYETFTGEDTNAFAPTVWIAALGFDIPSLNACAVTAELSVRVPEFGELEWPEGTLSSIYNYQLTSYKGIFTAKKSDSDESVKAQFEDLVQTMLVDIQKQKQSMRKELIEQDQTEATEYWIEQLK